LHDDGKTGGILNSWGQYAKSGDIIFDVAGGLGAGVALRASSKVVGKVVGKIKKYTPINPGPLDKRIADTFRSSSYTEKITPKEIILYRVISKNGNPTGNYLTRAKPRGPLASVIDSSLDQNWGNTATKIVKLKIPKGIKLYAQFLSILGRYIWFPPPTRPFCGAATPSYNFIPLGIFSFTILATLSLKTKPLFLKQKNHQNPLK
jgi:hypothetical protein